MSTHIGRYLDSVQIVPYNPTKHHPNNADVLPNDNEALLIPTFATSTKYRIFCFFCYSCFWVKVFGVNTMCVEGNIEYRMVLDKIPGF